MGSPAPVPPARDREEEMDQVTLLQALYRACVGHDSAKQRELLLEEFSRVFERRAEGKGFDVTWTVIRG
jgi:hypothetical protein